MEAVGACSCYGYTLTMAHLGRVQLVVTEVIVIAAGKEGQVGHEVFRHQPLDGPCWRRLHAQEGW